MTKLRRPYFKTPVMPKNMACLLWSEGKSKKFQLQLTHIQNSFPSATFHWRMGGHAHHSHDGGGEIFAEYRTKIAKRIFRVENLSTVGGGMGQPNAWWVQPLGGPCPPMKVLPQQRLWQNSTFLDISRHVADAWKMSKSPNWAHLNPISLVLEGFS